ncbi:hypothetical protein PO883_26700 [Massilia sp. DJPM01]|uniref:hypothetical protein n=1 Tax=Massilia sp. DJPM01 TaxID=3024404 RepID=UPI00259DC648|nr:hypothetical protein [Massilia sp. DJPM01]MDM5180778.1 hypothetical protein [Massilia sp. DJPM01]
MLAWLAIDPAWANRGASSYAHAVTRQYRGALIVRNGLRQFARVNANDRNGVRLLGKLQKWKGVARSVLTWAPT